MSIATLHAGTRQPLLFTGAGYPVPSGDSTIWPDVALVADLAGIDARTGDLCEVTEDSVTYRYSGSDWQIWVHPPVSTSTDFLKDPTAEGASGISGTTTYRYTTLSDTGYWIPEVVYLAGATREAWFSGDETNVALAAQGWIVTQAGGASIATNGVQIVASCTTSSDTARLSRNNAAWTTSTGIWFRGRIEVTSWTFVDAVNTFVIAAQFSDSANFVRLGLINSDNLSFNLFGSSEFAANTLDFTGGEFLVEGIIKPDGSAFWAVFVDGQQFGFARQNAGIASGSRSFALGASTSATGGESAVVAYRDFVLVSFPS